ncbi:hypothetical protein CONPUDRAFT_115281 [Coniophora puteana RWD-64-598 SS2]|uniref:YDG domain-containing protein n=1 Tax=Coniophora puteana (strain RWD-64-598) TaxID=741705 RepID=A0A5M3N5K0_CONPW|nr:uncharacterized protein CONPUDRAFT_115281 [Coniophora puteana RWD-64-598 SS2]EIW86679.1 hypothetical protein CONPUDRAFT_115281 [Coniophora puteana RWD-64-598 SS2]
MSSQYERERAANIARNKAILAALDVGRLRPKVEPKEGPRRVPKSQPTKKRHLQEVGNKVPSEDSPRKAPRLETDAAVGTRRSSRNTGKTVNYNQEQDRSVPAPVSEKRAAQRGGGIYGGDSLKRTHNPKTYGHISGVEVGTWWETRQACSQAAIHAPWVGGIAVGKDGAYSVALSGGYDDDVDDGYAFTYTGSGGRDLKGTKQAPKNLRTAPQSSDQTFENNFNQALKTSQETRKPIRVIRGFKLKSKYAPSVGYRYDGLYIVEKAWMEPGLNAKGWKVCKFAFKRLPGQPDLPVRVSEDEVEGDGDIAEDEEVEDEPVSGDEEVSAAADE